MAYKTEKREVKSSTIVITERTCDLCGRLAPCPGMDRAWDKMARGPQVTVEIKRGTVEEEGGPYDDTQETGFDVCPECWQAKVLPWFKSQGATPSDRRWYEGY